MIYKLLIDINYFICLLIIMISKFSKHKLRPISMNHMNQRCKPDNFELHSSLKLSFSNIQGLRSNFIGCELLFESISPDILTLCETNLSYSMWDKLRWICVWLFSFNANGLSLGLTEIQWKLETTTWSEFTNGEKTIFNKY